MELFTRQNVNAFLPRSAIWWKGFNLPELPAKLILKFSRLSKRKKLLALIMLTDPDNDRFPDLVGDVFGPNAGIYAWSALNWVVLNEDRVNRLLASNQINDQAREAIQIALRAKRCVEEISPILDRKSCWKASLTIAQHGSLKQRIGLVERMSSHEAEALVCGSNPDVVRQAIEWARAIDS